jgi:hypothetical protein
MIVQLVGPPLERVGEQAPERPTLEVLIDPTEVHREATELDSEVLDGCPSPLELVQTFVPPVVVHELVAIVLGGKHEQGVEVPALVIATRRMVQAIW